MGVERIGPLKNAQSYGDFEKHERVSCILCHKMSSVKVSGQWVSYLESWALWEISVCGFQNLSELSHGWGQHDC